MLNFSFYCPMHVKYNSTRQYKSANHSEKLICLIKFPPNFQLMRYNCFIPHSWKKFLVAGCIVVILLQLSMRTVGGHRLQRDYGWSAITVTVVMIVASSNYSITTIIITIINNNNKQQQITTISTLLWFYANISKL